jgi:Zn-dependent protease with chaperone function
MSSPHEEDIQDMSRIQVLLFGPELPVTGQSVHCIVGQDAIHIGSHQAVFPQPVRLAEMQAKVAGFEHNQLQLSWQSDDLSAWSLIPAGEGEQKKLIAALPHNIIPGLTQWKRSTQMQSRVWKGILYTLGFVGLALAILVWQHDRVTSWAANFVSLETEKSLGESVLNSLNPEANFLSQGAAVKTVEKIGQQLTTGSRYQYQWYVSKDPAINAFAIPGGIIVVNSGLLKQAETPEELAAVLAHEVQHVEQRHALVNMMNSAAIATIVLVVLGDANAVVMMMAHQVSAQYFNRQVESDADIKGIQLLHDKNIGADGMVSFFKKLEAGFNKKKEGTEKPFPENKSPQKQSSEKPSEVAGWFSSHPDTLVRIQMIEEYVAKHPCATCKALTWDKAALRAELGMLDKK